MGHAIAHHADEDGHCHGDHHPGGGIPAAERQLLLLFNGHKAQQDMGHAEISQAPGQQRADCQQAVWIGSTGGGIVNMGQGQIPRQGLCVLQHGVHTAGIGNAKAQHHHQSHRHDDGLHQIGKRCGQESAHNRINHDHRRGDQHGRHIVHSK